MTLKAPNGKKSNLTAEQYALVRTPEFKSWFGDWEKLAMAKLKDSAMDEVTLNNLSKNVSKVIDENGEPLVVYRSQKESSIRGVERQSKHYGLYFSENAESTKIYGEITKSYFLRLVNPDILHGLQWNLSVIPQYLYESMKSKGIDGGIWIRQGEMYEIVIFDITQSKPADGTNTTFDGSNPDIRYDEGGRVEHLIDEGIVDLKMYNTTPKHAKEYGLDSVNPLYVQSIYISENQRLKGIGKQVLEYIKDYAVENGHDVVFGHITQKAEPSVDVIKSMLVKSGFNTCEGNNDFYRIIAISDIRYNNGGKMKSVSNGTITIGKSHEEGGIPVYNKGTGQMLEVEGGEIIINKRSATMDKQVTFNGEKMTPCEVASEINQMGGGVAYNCNDALLSKEKYDVGGEFKAGRKMEGEHKKTLEKLYYQDITPDEAIDDIVEEHLSEDDKYYSKLSGIIEESKQKSTRDILRELEPHRKKHECYCETNKFNDGGETEKDLSNIDLPKNLDNYDILGEKGIYEERPTVQLSEQDKINAQKLGNAIKKIQELINIDYKPIIMADTENKKLHRYVEKVRHLNLYKLGWRANVGTSKAWAGICMYGGKQQKREILMSYDFIVGDDAFEENLEDVMLHEIAHAIVSELFILNPFDLPLDKLKPSRIKDLSLYETRLDIIDQTHSQSGGHGIMWAAVCESISKGFICDMFYRLAEKNELMEDYKYKCIRCNNEEYGSSAYFANKCSKCDTPVLVIKNKL